MDFGWINLFGGIIVLLILIPNIIYAVKTKNQTPTGTQIPKFLLLCEQVGRYGCIILMWLPLFVWKFGFDSGTGFVLYLVLNSALILAYYIIWIVYFREVKFQKKTLKTRMELALIPTAIFILSAILLKHYCLLAFAVLFGICRLRITKLSGT